MHLEEGSRFFEEARDEAEAAADNLFLFPQLCLWKDAPELVGGEFTRVKANLTRVSEGKFPFPDLLNEEVEWTAVVSPMAAEFVLPHEDGGMEYAPATDFDIAKVSTRVKAMVQGCGMVGRAYRLCGDKKPAPPSEATKDLLISKRVEPHTDENLALTQEYLDELEDSVKADVGDLFTGGREPLSKLGFDHVMETVRTSPKGSSPGPSGMVFEHFRPLLADPSEFEVFTALLNRFYKLDGSRYPRLRSWLASGREVALAKRGVPINTDLRGITICDTFTRLVSRAVAAVGRDKDVKAVVNGQHYEENEENHLRGLWSHKLGELQFGVGVRGGASAIPHLIRMALDASDPKDVALVSLDGKNAFGAMSRRKVAKAVATEFSKCGRGFV